MSLRGLVLPLWRLWSGWLKLGWRLGRLWRPAGLWQRWRRPVVTPQGLRRRKRGLPVVVLWRLRWRVVVCHGG